MDDTVWMGNDDAEQALGHRMTVEDVRRAVDTGDYATIQRAMDAYVAARDVQDERRPPGQWLLDLRFTRRVIQPLWDIVKDVARVVLDPVIKWVSR